MSRIRSGLLVRAFALVATVCASLPLAPAALRAETYAFDREHTAIAFSWTHLGLSRQSGRVMSFEGTIDFDPEKPEEGKVDVTMQVASLWTGVAKLDEHLKSADYFDAVKHPTITFKSTGIRKTGEKTGEVSGDLTIMGTTKPVTLAVTWNFTGEHPLSKFNPVYKDRFVSGFSAVARVNRSDWGVNRAVPLVSDEIQITIETELFKK